MCKDMPSHEIIYHQQDIRTGGRWRMDIRDAAKNEAYWGEGTYLEVTPPEKSVLYPGPGTRKLRALLIGICTPKTQSPKLRWNCSIVAAKPSWCSRIEVWVRRNSARSTKAAGTLSK